jgi:hypothetical protein
MATEKKTTKKATKKATTKKATKKAATKKVSKKAVTKTPAKKASKKKATGKKASSKKTLTEEAPVSREDIFRRVELEAFLMAERDNFKADPLCYWIAAEKAVMQSLG